MTESPPEVEVISAGRALAGIELKEEEGRPGWYTGAIHDLPPGAHTLRASGPIVRDLLAQENYSGLIETEFIVDPEDNPELRNTLCNLPRLQQIAEVTGGMVVQPTALKCVAENLDLSPEVTEHRTQRPWWNPWTCLWIFLGCLTFEWVVRKMAGMA